MEPAAKVTKESNRIADKMDRPEDSGMDSVMAPSTEVVSNGGTWLIECRNSTPLPVITL